MLIDEKDDDFLILAELPSVDGKLYAFRVPEIRKAANIVVVEDIPCNYPRIGIYTTKGVKGLLKDLKRRDWTIVKNHVT